MNKALHSKVTAYLATKAIAAKGSSHFTTLPQWAIRWQGDHPFNAIVRTFN